MSMGGDYLLLLIKKGRGNNVCLVGLQSILVPTQIQLAHLVLSDYYFTGLYLAYEVTSYRANGRQPL